jgi:hypothetical protein
MEKERYMLAKDPVVLTRESTMRSLDAMSAGIGVNFTAVIWYHESIQVTIYYT